MGIERGDRDCMIGKQQGLVRTQEQKTQSHGAPLRRSTRQEGNKGRTGAFITVGANQFTSRHRRGEVCTCSSTFILGTEENICLTSYSILASSLDISKPWSSGGLNLLKLDQVRFQSEIGTTTCH
jgi:hypothetical protein